MYVFFLLSQAIIILFLQKDKKVPTIVPPDCSKGLMYIADTELRNKFDIHSEYVFATKSGIGNRLL